jgi:lipoate-protein ligase A
LPCERAIASSEVFFATSWIDLRIADRNPEVYPSAVRFTGLKLWIDDVARSGPEAMAVDEWLLSLAQQPVLRVYGWSGSWGSVGYFGSLEAAKSLLPGLNWVRRWTGGGTVDHRDDWTYTLVVPAGHECCGSRGAESYRLIHGALAQALCDEGGNARLADGHGQTGSALCFQNPVGHDVIDGAGVKLAGAGQRRTRIGLLHQGSVAGRCDAAKSATRARMLARRLTEECDEVRWDPDPASIAALVAARYGSSHWTEGRRGSSAITPVAAG